jgi:glycosyltransferase involved in cell wall biosynthesis
LEPGKNLGLAVSAFEAVAKRNDEVRLALAGDRGWNYEPLIRQIGESPVRDRILLLGHVPDQDVVELMRGCSAFLYPSRYEGFGMPPLEALACGAPVISSTGGSLSEVLAGLPGVTPLLHDDLPGWTRAMAFSLERGAPSLEDRMRWATEVRRKYDWRVAASLTFDVWHDALNAG